MSAEANTARLRARWAVAPGTAVNLSAIDPDATPDAPGDREATEAATHELLNRLGRLQTALYAEGERSLLLVLQGMDASGKDGTVKNVVRACNPMGVQLVGFRAPTEEERAHDFLWRVHKQVPLAGHLGVFNRSHYEDVLVVRVMGLAPDSVWRQRFDLINAFEATLAHGRTRVVKLCLHISKDEQAARFRERLTKTHKRWKFNADDLDHRARWEDYMAAYSEALSRTSTDDAPWYVVPADHKWYRNWVAAQILVETLEEMDPQYPERPDLEAISVI
jgi:PPK2 family polyphosphate:nucleotide phosphotransferase